MPSSAPAYTGVWTNWNYGPTKGATLTLQTRDSSYLVAFLALFVSLAGGHFWSIICYAVFQTRSTIQPRSGQHHQQQAILRNYHSAPAALWRLLKSMWYWNGKRGFIAT